jgi:hypothetical protein
MRAAEDPLAALDYPEEWPAAAAALVQRGDRGALGALVEAYDSRAETSRLPLLEAMDALGGVEAAGELGASADANERWLAARLAHLLPGGAHLRMLSRLVQDPDPRTAREARSALRVQPRDASWRSEVERLALGDDPELRQAAEAWQREA